MSVALKSISLLNALTAGIREKELDALGKLVEMGRTCIDFTAKHPDHMNAIMQLEGFELQSISYTVEEMRRMIYQESPVGLVLEIVEQGVREKMIRNDIPALVIAHTLWMQMLGVIRFIMKKTALFEMLELSPTKVYESHFELVLNGIRS